MSTSTLTPAAERYVRAVADLLPELPAEEREELVSELAAHLAEIGDDDIETTLGTPADFVGEYRRSAGLNEARWSLLASIGALPVLRPVTELWSRVRRAGSPEVRSRAALTWTAVRGWLAVALVAATTRTPFEVFPIPRIESTAVGFVIVVAATWVSFRLARRSSRSHRLLDRGFTAAVAALWIVVGLEGSLQLSTTRLLPGPVTDTTVSGGPALLGTNGPIGNIFAFDEAGNPVRVLLYDEHGAPIRTLPDAAFDMYRDTTAMGESFVWDGYEVRLPVDVYGRIVPNLYPLERYWPLGGTPPNSVEAPPLAGIPELEGQATATTSPAPPAPTAPSTTTSSAVPSAPPETTVPGEAPPAAG